MSKRKWSAEYQIVDTRNGDVWAEYGAGPDRWVCDDMKIIRRLGMWWLKKRRVPQSEKGMPEGCKIGFMFECLLPEYRP